MKLHLVALALGSFSTLGFAHSRSDDGAAEEGWLDLDTKLGAMTESVLPDGMEADVHLLLRSFYSYSDDAALGASSEDAISGVTLVDAGVALDVSRGRTEGRVSFDLANGTGLLEDAWVRWRKSERFVLRAGNFRPRVLFSNSVDPELLLFQDRTYLGSTFDYFDKGVELSGHYDQFDWWFAINNGPSGAGSDHTYVLRGEWAHYDAAWELQEGARNAPNHLRVLMGMVFAKESYTPGSHDADWWGMDMALTFGPYAFHTEWMKLGDGSESMTRGTGVPPLTLAGDSSPWDMTLSRMYGPEWQAALRRQIVDDSFDVVSTGLALHYYPEQGPVGYVIEAVYHDADSGGPEGTFFRAGINVGRTR